MNEELKREGELMLELGVGRKCTQCRGSGITPYFVKHNDTRPLRACPKCGGTGVEVTNAR